MDASELALDGNALAGALAEVFGGDVTAVQGTCDHCGAVAALAETRVYMRAPGAVARCRSCDAVLLVVVEGRGSRWIGFGRLRCLEVPAGTA